ncbi:MAG TPA: hypothetical protein DCE42_00090 [Myxococcales bacterium]|nr:hypothetical protein [Deltaproteobacteria bacterium]MBU50380.1 hypothetical protein [Deltaproteobacteria bacterium]HAA53120.1 hypothetical protein [Myxococcales bacterium]
MWVFTVYGRHVAGPVAKKHKKRKNLQPSSIKDTKKPHLMVHVVTRHKGIMSHTPMKVADVLHFSKPQHPLPAENIVG